MTLAALLEELEAVDLETWESLRRYPIYVNDGQSVTIDIMVSSNDTIVNDAVQGCIQRAIVGRGWGFAICEKMADVSTPDNIYDSPLCDSPAEALLAAYIAAVRGEEEAKR